MSPLVGSSPVFILVLGINGTVYVVERVGFLRLSVCKVLVLSESHFDAMRFAVTVTITCMQLTLICAKSARAIEILSKLG